MAFDPSELGAVPVEEEKQASFDPTTLGAVPAESKAKDFNPDTSALRVPESHELGFFDQISKSFHDSASAINFGTYLVKQKKEDVLSLAEEEYKNRPQETERTGFTGTVAKVVGGAAPVTVPTVGAGLLGSLATPFVGAGTGTLTGTMLGGLQGAGGAFKNAYFSLRDKGITPEDAYSTALTSAEVSGAINAVINAAAPGVGKLASTVTSKPLAQVGASIVGNAAVGGVAQTTENLAAQQIYDPQRGTFEGVPEALLTQGAFGAAVEVPKLIPLVKQAIIKSRMEAGVAPDAQPAVITETKVNDIPVSTEEQHITQDGKVISLSTKINPDELTRQTTEQPATPSMEAVSQEPQAGQAEGQVAQQENPLGLEERRFPKRVGDYEGNADLKAAREADPTIKFYDKQSLKSSAEQVQAAPSGELENLIADLDVKKSGDNVGVLAGIEQMNRLRAAGDTQGATAVFKRLSQSGTTMGQLIRQFAELKGSTPEGVLETVQKDIEFNNPKLKLKPETQEKILDHANEDIIARQKFREAEASLRENFSDANLQRVADLEKQSAAASLKLQKTVNASTPKSAADIASQAIQGNLLTPLSQAFNIWGNAVNLPARVIGKTIMTPADALISYIKGNPRTIKTGLPEAKAYVEGFAGKGLSSALDVIKKGSSSEAAIKGEIAKGFQPIRSFAQAFSGADLPVNEQGKVPTGVRFNKFFEGLVGGPPEVMFRFLGAGDVVFREATTKSRLVEQARIAGLKPGTVEFEKFLRFPPKAVAELASNEAAQSVFNQENRAANWVQQGFKHLENVPGVGGALKFLAKTQVPYVRTPLNIISETLDYAVPPLSLAKAIRNAKLGDRRTAQLQVGKAIVGTMMITAADGLFKAGVISASADKDAKKRQLQYEMFPPNSINVSGVQRMLEGGNPAVQKGDQFINYSRMGILGAVMGIRANEGEESKSSTASGASQAAQYMAQVVQGFPALASFAVDQSFLKGASSLVEAISTHRYDEWMGNTFKAVTSIALPNTMDAANRASREYLPDARGNNIEERLGNVIKGKLFMTEDLPIKRGLFGEKITQTPRGSEGWLHNFVDVFDYREGSTNQALSTIKKIYDKTDDADVIPSVPARSFTKNGKTTKLDDVQYERFVTLIGEARREEVTHVLKDPAFQRMKPEMQIKELKSAYDAGYETGKERFAKPRRGR
jgi:hypothetical protein